MEYKQSEMQSTINPSGAQSEMIRILLIEDNPGDAQLVQEMLNEAEGTTFRLERVDRLSEGLRLLTEEKFDLILLDLSLPDGQGLEMLEKVQACVRTTPVVLLTGTFEEEPIAIKALQSGAEDYLYKGNIDSKLLVRSVRYAIERKRAEEQQKILSTIMEAVHKSLDLEEVYNIALDMTVALENVDMAMIYLVDADRKETIVQAQRNIPEDYIRRAGRIPYPKGITWKVINSGEIMNIGDAQKDPEIGPAGRDLGHHGVLGIPITLEGRTIGVIWFFSYKERKFSRHEVDFLSSIGNQVATAIAKAKLYRELSKKNRYETIISTITRSVHQSINLQDVLENAVEAMSKNINNVDCIAIYLVEGEEAVLRACRGFPEWYIGRAGRIPYPKGVIWKTIIGEKQIYCADVDQDTVIGPAGREVGIKSYVSMPIHSEGKTVGAIGINSFKKNAFDEEELKLLGNVAQQIKTAINNAKQAEEIRKLNEELEKRVAERTVQLEAANKELEAFSYSVSHDLRAPLRAIEGFSGILLEECSSHLDAEGQRFLNIIRMNVKQMSQLIDDLLAFSRLNRQEIVLSEVKMEKLVKDIFEELKFAISERNLEFNVKVLPNAYGDRAMIRQVFINLLSNAIKFTRSKGRAIIEIGSRIEDQQNVYYVKDNGVGFDMQYVDKLFGVFQRLHMMEEFEGTGVGLAIVRRVIHRHGGQVWAEGKVGEGAAFYFTLPRIGNQPKAEN